MNEPSPTILASDYDTLAAAHEEIKRERDAYRQVLNLAMAELTDEQRARVELTAIFNSLKTK